MTTHPHLPRDVLRVCFDAVDILLENDVETISGIMGSDWETESLNQLVSEGPCADYDQTDLDNIQSYLDRFNAKLRILEFLYDE